MDFHSLMNAANKNAKKTSKEMGKIDEEVNKEKNEVKRQLDAERRLRLEMQRKKAERAKEIEMRKEEERRKNFTIPKKEEKTVNPDALKAYYEKQEASKREKQKAAEIEKERLMRLRMQANGGKATKKIGKHFGLDPITLQIRFGGNNEHIETLQKRKCKEEEETEMEAERYRNGVYKALQMKKKNEERLRVNVKGPHRMATSKANSLAGLCGRHEKTRDTFSPPKDGQKEKREEKKVPEKRKIQPAAPVDFKSLMEAAAHISQGKQVKLDKFEQRPHKQSSSHVSKQPSTSNRSSDNGSMKNRERNSEREKERVKEKRKEDIRMKEKEKERSKLKSDSRQSEQFSKIPQKPVRTEIIRSVKSIDIGESSSSEPSNSSNDKKKENKGRFTKGPTPPPAIPGIIPGKRYLPSDIRYKEAMALAKQTQGGTSFKKPETSSSTSSAYSSKNHISNVREQEKQRERDREKLRQLKREREREYEQESDRAEKMRRLNNNKPKSDSRSYERRREEELREQQRMEKYGKSKHRRENHSSSSFCRGGDDYSDNEDDYEEDEDDYDSDMDDFIDDSEVDMDGMNRKEFEKTLKMVNRKYDTNKWSQREKMISERDMISDYRRIQSEESYSKRAGLIEDLREASKGRSVRL